MNDSGFAQTQIPDRYAALLRKIAPLNRVHNGEEMDQAVDAIAEFCRTMPGQTNIHEYTPGTTYNHWIVPPHWKINKFSIVAPDGRELADMASHPLALSPFSCSVRAEVSREELLQHVVTRTDKPHVYSFFFRRMYRHWDKDWNISIPYEVIRSLPEGHYKVDIDVEFSNKPMKVFEYIAEGRRKDSIVLCGHLDHPGMVNDSLSGCLASLQAVDAMGQTGPEFTYRAWLLPEIIASAVHLDAHPDITSTIRYALCPNMTAHPAPLALCYSKSQTSFLDRAMRLALTGGDHVIGGFHKYPDCGDEISFDAVGLRIPATTLSRIGEMFANYHTSDDNVETFLSADWQARHQQALSTIVRALGYLERNRTVQPTFRGNPCLSNPALDLYLQPSNLCNQKISEGLIKDLHGNNVDLRNFMEFFLEGLSRENLTILEIADGANLPFDFVADYAARFESKGMARFSWPERAHVAVDGPTTALRRAELIEDQ